MTTNPRLQQLYSLMKQFKLDALVLNPSPTQYYFCGLHLGKMERPHVLILGARKKPVQLCFPNSNKINCLWQPSNWNLSSMAPTPPPWQEAFNKLRNPSASKMPVLVLNPPICDSSR